MLCLREPSLGPCFGDEGRRRGRRQDPGHADGRDQPPFHRRFPRHHLAHNLLSAMIDNHIYWGNPHDIDLRRVIWRRVIDMNDRALRQIVGPLGGVSNGFPRESGFDITVASEIMAILCLASDLKDLQKRMGDIIVGYARQEPGVLPRHQGRQRDDRAAQGRDPAQPGADAGEPPRLPPRRPLRQYRPRLQFGDRHQDRAENGRLCRDRGGLRCRSRRGKVHGYQVPTGGNEARCHRDRRHRARAQDERRGLEGRAGGEPIPMRCARVR